MPEMNFLAIFVAALVPNILGAIYYGPLFGKQWLSSLGYTAEDMKGRNDALNYGTAFLLSVIVAGFIKLIFELTHKNVSDAGELIYASFHTFGHGALHGSGFALMLVVPIIISLGIFQKNSLKNILLNSIFWLLCLATMGGILDAWH